MTFSIITPSLNCGDFISKNFASIRQQGFGPGELEHWVIDGGSTDGTVDFLKREKDIKWISEPDKGLSDAVNKGIQRAKGDWILWVNADDFLADNALKIFLDYTKRYPGTRIFCGHQTVLRYDGSTEMTKPAWDYNLKQLLGARTSINQASTFIHREAYHRVGLLDVSDRYTMDYEWLVRAMHIYKCVPIPQVLTYYQRRKNSITDANTVKQFEKFLEIRRKYNQPRFSSAEFRVRFYLYTEPLRRMRRLRLIVRSIKTLLGMPPPNPLS